MPPHEGSLSEPLPEKNSLRNNKIVSKSAGKYFCALCGDSSSDNCSNLSLSLSLIRLPLSCLHCSVVIQPRFQCNIPVRADSFFALASPYLANVMNYPHRKPLSLQTPGLDSGENRRTSSLSSSINNTSEATLRHHQPQPLVAKNSPPFFWLNNSFSLSIFLFFYPSLFFSVHLSLNR